MKSLSRFEANLMSILYGLLGERPQSAIAAALDATLERPSCLTRDTVEMVQDALRKGLVKWLAETDGWQTQRFLRRDEVVQGRLWERSEASELAMDFTGHTLDFLMTITAGNDKDDASRWAPRGLKPLALGDLIFLFKAFDTVREMRVARHWAKMKAIRAHPLVALCMPHRSAGNIDFTEWMDGTRASILEGLQSKLARDWAALELAKIEIAQINDLKLLGRRQVAVLTAFMDACEKANRLDLSRFILSALRTTSEVENVSAWVSMDLSSLKITERQEVYEAAAGFLSVAHRLRKWHEKCQATGYFDEGYAAAQLWLVDWERYDSERVVERALALRQELVEF